MPNTTDMEVLLTITPSGQVDSTGKIPNANYAFVSSTPGANPGTSIMDSSGDLNLNNLAQTNSYSDTTKIGIRINGFSVTDQNGNAVTAVAFPTPYSQAAIITSTTGRSEVRVDNNDSSASQLVLEDDDKHAGQYDFTLKLQCTRADGTTFVATLDPVITNRTRSR